MSEHFCSQPAAQQQQARLEVVLPLRQIQRLVEPQLAVRELHAPFSVAPAQQLPQDFRGQAADQVLAVDQNALIARVVGHLSAADRLALASPAGAVFEERSDGPHCALRRRPLLPTARCSCMF